MDIELEKRHSDMVWQLAKSGEDIVDGLTKFSAHNLHMAVGISGEVAECIEALFGESREHTVEEIGDLNFYITGLKLGLKIETEFVEFSGLAVASLPPIANVAIKMSISSGFLLDIIKKQSVYGKMLDVDDVIHELQILESCIRRIYLLCGITREECLEANYKKLGSRYKDHQYSDEQAQLRNDKTGES